MLLAIDIGNSNIVLGCIEDREITHEARIATDLIKTSDQYCVDIKSVLALYDINLAAIEGVIISSVVPPVLNSFRTAIMKCSMSATAGKCTGTSSAGWNSRQRRNRTASRKLFPGGCILLRILL